MSKTIKDTVLRDTLLKAYSSASLAGGSAVQALRTSAKETLSASNFPSVRHEEWKYTNVAQIAKEEYQFEGDAIDVVKVKSQPLYALTGSHLVFVNGIYNEALSSIEDGKFTVQTLGKALTDNNALVEQHLGNYARLNDEGDNFVAANNLLFNEGVFVHVPKSSAIENPIYIHHWVNAASKTLVQPRNLFIVEENAEVQIVERVETLGIEKSLVNTLTEIYVAKHARAYYTQVQNDKENANQITTTSVYQERESNFSAATFTTGGGLVRNTLSIKMDDEYSEANMWGLFLTNGKMHVDNHTVVDHAKPNCESNELYKGVLNDQSTGVFNGKIFVREDAQKTNAFQSNKNVILSDKAIVNTKPQLEIWADDVKCSHGSTTGKLEDEAIFYMQARGISKINAQKLLLKAFAGDVVAKVKSKELQEYLFGIIDEKLS